MALDASVLNVSVALVAALRLNTKQFSALVERLRRLDGTSAAIPPNVKSYAMEADRHAAAALYCLEEFQRRMLQP